MAANDMLPGESTLQYYLRQGMDPNSASGALASNATGNGASSPAQVAQRAQQTVQNYDARNAQINAGVRQNDWFGNNVNDKTGAYYTGPSNTGPRQVQSPLDASFYGGYGADSVSSASRGNISIPGVANTSPNLQGGWGNVVNKGDVANPVAPYTGQYYSAARGDNQQTFNTNYQNIGKVNPGTPGAVSTTPVDSRNTGSPAAAAQQGVWNGDVNTLPAMNQGEDSAGYMHRIGLNDQQVSYAQALAKANPNASFQEIMQYMQSKTNQNTNNNGLPPINQGEDSTAYMKRIGMSDNAIQYALALSKSNPGASFQQIMTYMRNLATQNKQTQPVNSPVNALERQRQQAWAAYYASQGQGADGAQRGGLSSTGNIRYGDTPVLTIPQG